MCICAAEEARFRGHDGTLAPQAFCSRHFVAFRPVLRACVLSRPPSAAMEDAASFDNRPPVLLGRRPVKGDVEAGKMEQDGIQAQVGQVVGKSKTVDAWHEKCCEKTALVLGMIFAVVQGVSAPAIALFMGESITTLAVADHANELDAMKPELIKAGHELVDLRPCNSLFIEWVYLSNPSNAHKIAN